MFKLGNENVKKILKSFGLTEKETEVYIFLAKYGVQRSGEIAKGIKTHRAEVYRMLKSLQTKGLVQPTLESPTRFATVPFETVIDSFIKTKREEAASIESAKQDLLEDWKIISRHEPESQPERFVVIEGNRKIYPKILQMIKDTENQFSAIATIPSLVRGEQFGLFDTAFTHPLKSSIQFRFLTELSEQNLNVIKTLVKRAPRTGFNFKGRNPAIGLKSSPRMVIRDQKEILFFITPRADVSSREEEVCLWTNCLALVQSFVVVFEELWANSIDIQNKIVELETGMLEKETSVMEYVDAVHKKHVDVLRSAEKEIMMMISAENLSALCKSTTLFNQLFSRGVSVRIMAPVTTENFEATVQLKKYFEVRHVPESYLETIIVDRKHLFQFKTTLPGQEEPETTTQSEAHFYTNDAEHVERMINTLDGIWKSARAPSSVTLASITRPYGFMPPPFVSNPFKKVSRYTFLEEKPRTISEKDILNKIIKAKESMVKNTLSEALKMYAIAAAVIIHPPDSFKLPDMMLHINHVEKPSVFGRGDALMVYLWVETPEGYSFVPAGGIGDNPRGVSERRRIHFSDSLAKQKYRLVKRDELHVRAYGNTLFCGWTVPIPLFPQKYVLPPACLLVEGYGNVKTRAYTITFPSGYKCQMEQNYFDAFVTFMHPSSKYTGPGTDGAFIRDLIVTTTPPRKVH
jgi:sugar-specific transcriptional regulator TrmB